MLAFKKVSLTFEVSHGCQLSCEGCRVDKHQTSLPNAEQSEQLLGLFQDLADRQTNFAEFELGPTDLISCGNRDEIFVHPTVTWLAKHFSLLALNVGMVYPKVEEYERFAEQVAGLSETTPVALIVPIDLKHAFNEKYASVVRRNVEAFRRASPNPYRETIIKVIIDDRYMTNEDGSRRSYRELFSQVQSLDLGPESKVDFGLHHGRSGNISDPIVSASFLKSFRALNEAYVHDIKQRAEAAQPRHLPYQLVQDPPSGELMYNSGNLYIRPVLHERMNVAHPLMRFEPPWTTENYFNELMVRLHDNLELAQTFEDCPSCPHVSVCATRTTHQLMHLVHTKRCISLLKDYGSIGAVAVNENPGLQLNAGGLQKILQ